MATFKVGDTFFFPSSGQTYRISAISPHGEFLNWEQKFEDKWIVHTHPTKTEDLELGLKQGYIMVDTIAGRLFFEKEK